MKSWGLIPWLLFSSWGSIPWLFWVLGFDTLAFFVFGGICKVDARFCLFGGFLAPSRRYSGSGMGGFLFLCLCLCLLDVDCGLRAVEYVFSFRDQQVGYGSDKNTHVRVDVSGGKRPVERLGR